MASSLGLCCSLEVLDEVSLYTSGLDKVA
jgi:hypothetical protein